MGDWWVRGSEGGEEISTCAAGAVILEHWLGSKFNRVTTLLRCCFSAALRGDCCLSCFILLYLTSGDLTGLFLGIERRYSATEGLVTTDGLTLLAPTAPLPPPVGVEVREGATSCSCEFVPWPCCCFLPCSWEIRNSASLSRRSKPCS